MHSPGGMEHYALSVIGFSLYFISFKNLDFTHVAGHLFANSLVNFFVVFHVFYDVQI